MTSAVARTLASHGRLDIVVNNAGSTHRNQPLLDVSEAEFDKLYAINVKSIYHMTLAAVPVMRRQGGGCIINMGSTAGIRPRPGLTWYNGSKGAVHLLSRSMAAELAPNQIRVNCVAPVLGETGLLEILHGIAGHAGEPCEIRRHHPARPAVAAHRHRQCLPLPRFRRGRVRHRRGTGGGWGEGCVGAVDRLRRSGAGPTKFSLLSERTFAKIRSSLR